jgi:hypothetical protein
MSSKDSSIEPDANSIGLNSLSPNSGEFELNDFEELVKKYDELVKSHNESLEAIFKLISKDNDTLD